MTLKKQAAELFSLRQNEICAGLEQVDIGSHFRSDSWERPAAAGSSMHGGGGLTRVIRGKVFEQGGVNFSEVKGELPVEMSRKLIGADKPSNFYATGVSLVIHPKSPLVPTVHANFRYLEVENHAWFGGGMDLTPYYLYEEDACHFHATLKSACDKHNLDYYPKFKKWCDEYFFIPHRGETRGIGGIFFDYLGKNEAQILDTIYSFVSDVSSQFLNAYVPIVMRRMNLLWDNTAKEFQLWRRGRYAEFNLVYDRGTQFGLATGGRAESILMSLPPYARWEYDYLPVAGTEEMRLVEILRKPREWV